MDQHEFYEVWYHLQETEEQLDESREVARKILRAFLNNVNLQRADIIREVWYKMYPWLKEGKNE